MGISRVLLGGVLLLAALACGCATVEPWQRERLSKGPMIFGNDPFREHWLTSREGSSGGFGVQGGGCGCK